MKAVGIGCGIVLLLLAILVGIAVWQAPKFIAMFNDMMAQEEQRQLLARNFVPPAADAPADDLFPAALGGYQRKSVDDNAAVPELDINLKGRHAVYENGGSRVDLYFYAITHLENEAIVKRVDKASQGSGSRSWLTVDLGDEYARAYLSSSRLGQCHFWFSRGRLLLLRTADADDREAVAQDFFRAHAKPAEKPAEAEPQDKAKPADKEKAAALLLPLPCVG